MSYGQNTRTTSGFSKPVETGKAYTIDITDTGRRIGGFVIFVKHAKVGDKSVKIKINSVGDRFAAATSAAAGSTDTT